MKFRALMTLTVLILMLTMVSACDKAEKALDAAGLEVGKDLSTMLGDATKLLGGITDLESAKAALPKLVKMEGGLGDIVKKAAELGPEAKQAMTGMVKKALPAFEAAVTKVTDLQGVGETVKPVLDSILAKVKGLM